MKNIHYFLSISYSLISLNLKTGCQESSKLLKGMDLCVDDKVFETDIFKMAIDYKWQNIYFTRIFLLI